MNITEGNLGSDESLKNEYALSYSSAYFHQNSMHVNWGSKTIGFGGIILGFDEEMGKIVCHSETMSKQFVTAVLAKLIEDSIFTDLEEPVKKSQTVSLAEANKEMAFKNNVLYQPFYSGDDNDNPTVYQMRWRISGGRVLNTWFDKAVIGSAVAATNSDALIEYLLDISKNKSFSKGFVKAEIWSWIMEEKP